jgi:hypothetical protein
VFLFSAKIFFNGKNRTVGVWGWQSSRIIRAGAMGA